MAKIDIEEVEQVLMQHKVNDTSAIIKDLQAILEELKAELKAENEDKPKWEHVVVVHDPSGKLEADKMDQVISAFVVQQEEGQDPATIFSRLREAVVTQNESAKRKKSRLENLRDIFDGLKPKYLKEKKVKIKTKEPVRVLLTTGKL